MSSCYGLSTSYRLIYRYFSRSSTVGSNFLVLLNALLFVFEILQPLFYTHLSEVSTLSLFSPVKDLTSKFCQTKSNVRKRFRFRNQTLYLNISRAF